MKKTEDITLWLCPRIVVRKVQLEVLLCKQMIATSDDILTPYNLQGYMIITSKRISHQILTANEAENGDVVVIIIAVAC